MSSSNICQIVDTFRSFLSKNKARQLKSSLVKVVKDFIHLRIIELTSFTIELVVTKSVLISLTITSRTELSYQRAFTKTNFQRTSRQVNGYICFC